MRLFAFSYLLISSAVALTSLKPQQVSSEQVQIGPPSVQRVQPPSPLASADDLEAKADELRSQKDYLDAIEYYREALIKQPTDARMNNKAGITELMLQRYGDARKNFERAIRLDSRDADAYNNLGVILYLEKKEGKAIKQYEKAISLRNDSASFYSNLGAAYFSRKQFEKATEAYAQAAKINPEIFDHTSHNGISAQMSSPQDRAHFDFVMARLFAKQGDSDRALLYLRKAMEEGYKGIDEALKDNEFAGLRKDARFNQLMAAKPVSIPE
jgi:tetratricopeptide (TPR) repeat protein